MLPGLLAEAHVLTTAFSPWHLSLSPHVREHIKGHRNARKAAAELRDLLSRRRFDWIVIGDESLLRALIDVDDLAPLASWFPVNPLDGDALGLVLSKYYFAERAPQLGILVPESRFATSVEEALVHATRWSYPVVLKTAHGFAGLDVHIVASEQELAVRTAALLVHHERVLVQRFIEGPQASACVLYDRGHVAGYSSYLAECGYPMRTSPSTVQARFAHPAIEPIIQVIGAATRFHGFVGIDFVLESKTQDLYAMEVNPRPTIGFSGTAETRAFFAPLVFDFVRDRANSMVSFDIRRPAEVQFPSHLFYFLTRANKRRLSAYRRIPQCLSEFRCTDAGLAAWQIARFFYDELSKRVPGVRHAVEAARRSDAPTVTKPFPQSQVSDLILPPFEVARMENFSGVPESGTV